MQAKQYHTARLVPKTPLSLVVLEWSGLESSALREVLEYFSYRVDTHWIGSRKEFLEVLKGSIPTADTIVLVCHGDRDDGIYTCPEEKPLLPEELAKVARLDGKTVVSLGCSTGTEEFAQAFLRAGCAAYVAPVAYPFGNSALLFAVHVFYAMARKKRALAEAVEEARQFDKESNGFRLWQRA